MNNISALYQLSLADFRERTRRYSFLVTMLGILFFGYLVITGQYTIQFGEFRTPYSSAWAGSLMGVCSSIMLAIVGFYLVKGSMGRDRQTEVGQIIAATPISRSAYIVSKFASNISVLCFMMAILAVVAFVMLLFRNETSVIDVWAFLSPFVIIGLPAIIFVSAMAVLFDTARWLRGSAGNIIYLFVAEFCLVLGMLAIPLLDLGAVSAFTSSIKSAAQAAFPGEKIGLLIGFVAFDETMQIEVFKTFPWDGIDWTFKAIVLRLSWVAVAGVAVSLALPFFDRFDPAKIKQKTVRKKKKHAAALAEAEDSSRRPELSYREIGLPQSRFRFVDMLKAELRVALIGYHWFWYAVALGLAVAQLAAPFDVVRLYLVPLSMAWPLIIWSSMGTREPRYNTGPLLFSSPDPVARQFPALWSSGVLVALAAVGCMAFRAVVAGQPSYTAVLLISAFLIPTAALALGTLSGSKKLFEVIYLMVWYVGSIDHLHAIDLLGTTPEAVSAEKFVVFGLLSIALLIAAFAARRMQMARA